MKFDAIFRFNCCSAAIRRRPGPINVPVFIAFINSREFCDFALIAAPGISDLNCTTSTDNVIGFFLSQHVETKLFLF
jgi:hypothetical protein